MSEKLYLVVQYPDGSMVLGLLPKSEDQIRSDIAWQRRGGFTEPMHACAYDAESEEFVSVSTGERFRPAQSIYTDVAWQRFQDHLRIDHAPSDPVPGVF